MKPGEKIKGLKNPPHGGTFIYDEKTDELECVTAGTDPERPAEAPKVEEDKDNVDS